DGRGQVGLGQVGVVVLQRRVDPGGRRLAYQVDRQRHLDLVVLRIRGDQRDVLQLRDEAGRRRQLPVDALDQVAVQRNDADRADHDETGQHQYQNRGDQLDPQRDPVDQATHPRYVGRRNTYPTPRSVWISRGSTESTFRRRYEMYDSTML